MCVWVFKYSDLITVCLVGNCSLGIWTSANWNNKLIDQYEFLLRKFYLSWECIVPLQLAHHVLSLIVYNPLHDKMSMFLNGIWKNKHRFRIVPLKSLYFSCISWHFFVSNCDFVKLRDRRLMRGSKTSVSCLLILQFDISRYSSIRWPLNA